MYYVGVDIGGTNLKIGLIQENNLIDKVVYPTNSFDLVKQITNSVQEILQKNSIPMTLLSGVGVGCPGIVKNGVVTHSVNLNLTEFHLQEILQAELGVNVIVLNDGDMATLAEHKLGAGHNCENMVLLTLGTGVGGGIIANGELYKGTEGAGELGHIPLKFGDKPCNCGQKGCIEQYVSCVALSKMALEEMKKYPESIIRVKDNEVRASDLIDAYTRSDDCAIQVVDKYVEYLSAGVMAYCNIFRPDTIVIGGGITHAPKIIEMVAHRVDKMNYGYPYSNKVNIVPAKLGSDAGILGTTVAFIDNVNNNLTNNIYENKYNREDILDGNQFADNQNIQSPENSSQYMDSQYTQEQDANAIIRHMEELTNENSNNMVNDNVAYVENYGAQDTYNSQYVDNQNIQDIDMGTEYIGDENTQHTNENELNIDNQNTDLN